VLELKGLSKRYNSIAAVDGVSFRIDPGEGYGYLGLNASGKITRQVMHTQTPTCAPPMNGAAQLDVCRLAWRTSESENAALSAPLSFVGMREELDRDFAKELAAYLETHRQLSSTLAEAKAKMEAAAKAQPR
jgi:PRTRC genetic system protein E